LAAITQELSRDRRKELLRSQPHYSPTGGTAQEDVLDQRSTTTLPHPKLNPPVQ